MMLERTSLLCLRKSKVEEKSEKQRARRGSKRLNKQEIIRRVAPGSNLCAHLTGIPDHVAEDLGCASRLHYVLGDPGAILSHSWRFLLSPIHAVLFVGIECVRRPLSFRDICDPAAIIGRSNNTFM